MKGIVNIRNITTNHSFKKTACAVKQTLGVGQKAVLTNKDFMRRRLILFPKSP